MESPATTRWYELVAGAIVIAAFLASISPQQATAQRFPTLSIQDGEETLPLDSFHVAVEVVGNRARTTIDMTFRNPTERTIEGQFTFPLTETQVLSRFAMSVDTLMREGVVVEKEKGTAVFEWFKRRRIDPGLLEMMNDESYRARIFPIFGGQSKRIILAYEEALAVGADHHTYTLPITLPHPVARFSFRVDVFGAQQTPVIHLPAGRAQIAPEAGHLVGTFEATDYRLSEPVRVQIPVGTTQQVFVEPDSSFSYFYATAVFPLAAVEKEPPRRIGLLWDASASAKTQDVERITDVLNQYFSFLETVEVVLLPFRDAMGEVDTFLVKDGKWEALRQRLHDVVYDGGTHFGSLDLNAYACDEYLLVSDGKATLGLEALPESPAPVYVLNTRMKAAHHYLDALAQETGGAYLRLHDRAPNEVFDQLAYQPFRLREIEEAGGRLTEVYPSLRVAGNRAYVFVAGKMKSESATLSLSISRGTTIYTEQVVLQTDAPRLPAGWVQRVWAHAKVRDLSVAPYHNAKAIAQLGKTFSMVTPGTSLIVLERVSDYVWDRIVPPPELQEEYFARMADREQERYDPDIPERFMDGFEEIPEAEMSKLWEDYRPTLPPEGDFPKLRRRRRPWSPRLLSKASFMEVPPHIEPDDSTGTLYGLVEEAFFPAGLPGAHIILRGTKMGVASDINGRYIIRNIPPGTYSVQSSFVGYIPAVMDSVAVVADSVMGIHFELEEGDIDMWGGIGVTMAERSVMGGIVMAGHAGKKRPYLDPLLHDAPYLRALEEAATHDLYNRYLGLRSAYEASPSFFLNVADYFETRGLSELAIRILTNLAEKEWEQRDVLRALGYRLWHAGHARLAIPVFEQLRTQLANDPSIYRDLAFLYEEAGQPQEAIDLLYGILDKTWGTELMDEVDVIEYLLVAYFDLGVLIERHGEAVELDQLNERLFHFAPRTFTVELQWDAAGLEVDLEVTDPFGETANYRNDQTRLEAMLLSDRRNSWWAIGQKRELFFLPYAPAGTYTIGIDYFKRTQLDKLFEPTAWVTVTTDYGMPTEQQHRYHFTLSEKEGQIPVAEITIPEPADE